MSPICLSSSVLVLLVTRISCWSLPAELEDDCQLEEEDHLQCLHLNSSQWAGLSLLPPDLTRLDIQRSDISCLDLSSLSHLTSLSSLSIRHSGLSGLCEGPHQAVKPLKRLTSLDLSHNKISRLGDSFIPLQGLTSLNMSHNKLHHVGAVMKQFRQLTSLDLSHNRLSHLDRRVMEELDTGALSHLDISHNPWPCLPSLSWLYHWSLSLSNTLRENISSSSSCNILNSPSGQHAPLLTVMEHYSRVVSPDCHPTCSCNFYHFAAGTNISYTVIVNCTNSSLTTFPSLPSQTTVLDLSHNKLTQDSLELLDVARQNYLDITSLILSHNKIQSIGTKLLKLKLHRSFKADHNSLTDIPYDFSQLLQKYDTMVISLANNPWHCTCNAQITDTVS